MNPTVAAADASCLWWDGITEPRRWPAPPEGHHEADVVIVGGGYSGLWTAYYLSRLDPGRRIVVIEREHCGFGASGRNGGWCAGEIAGSLHAYAARSGRSEARRQLEAVFEAVDEVGRVVAAEGIDCGYERGGVVRVARSGPQRDRQIEEVAELAEFGIDDSVVRLLGADEARRRVHATEVRGGLELVPAATVDPGALVRGLAGAVVRSGVEIWEGVGVRSLGDADPGRPRILDLDPPGMTVRAPVVVRATEAYTRDLPGLRRELLPVYSLMVATEPLAAEVFDEIGLDGRPTFADDRYLVIYGQRTADNRIAFGGRGVPYLFGSRIDATAEQRLGAHQLIADTLGELFPILAEVRITHRWGGVLAIPRRWMPAVGFDRTAGLGHLGGYVGEGVAASNLAGRTLAELIVGSETDRTSLPWVGLPWRRWEPEPFRWLGVRASRRILVGADEREFATDRPSALAVRVAEFLRNPGRG